MPYPSHIQRFRVITSPYWQAYMQHPDKMLLRELILELRHTGYSYREISERVGLHYTRVGQIVRGE